MEQTSGEENAFDVTKLVGRRSANHRTETAAETETTRRRKKGDTNTKETETNTAHILSTSIVTSFSDLTKNIADRSQQQGQPEHSSPRLLLRGVLIHNAGPAIPPLVLQYPNNGISGSFILIGSSILDRFDHLFWLICHESFVITHCIHRRSTFFHDSRIIDKTTALTTTHCKYILLSFSLIVRKLKEEPPAHALERTWP
jgi:hypothetical protein